MDMVDFNDFDKVGNGFDDEPSFRKVHREKLPETITGGVTVDRSKKLREDEFLDHLYGTKRKFKTIPMVKTSLLPYLQRAVFENGEPSQIYDLAERIRKSNIVELAGRTHKLLGLPLETVFMEMCAAWLRDMADQHIDRDSIDENDHWRWSRRYPRLYESAIVHPAEFQLFQTAIGKYLALPDLTEPQITASEIKAEREADFVALRKDFDLQHPNLKPKAA